MVPPPQVRNQLVLHNGYEVEVEKGNFVCAFRDACDSIKFATAVNILLVDMSWGSEVQAQPWGCEQRNAANEVIFRGLRLSIGMCTGDAMRVQPCMRTGKMEYYGPIMNHAARVAVAAHAGQAWSRLFSSTIRLTSCPFFTCRQTQCVCVCAIKLIQGMIPPLVGAAA